MVKAAKNRSSRRPPRGVFAVFRKDRGLNGKDILLRRADIHFYALSDRYTVDAPFYGKNIYSLGDFVLFAGGALVIAQAVWSFMPRRRRKEPESGLPEAGRSPRA